MNGLERLRHNASKALAEAMGLVASGATYHQVEVAEQAAVTELARYIAGCQAEVVSGHERRA